VLKNNQEIKINPVAEYQTLATLFEIGFLNHLATQTQEKICYTKYAFHLFAKLSLLRMKTFFDT